MEQVRGGQSGTDERWSEWIRGEVGRGNYRRGWKGESERRWVGRVWWAGRVRGSWAIRTRGKVGRVGRGKFSSVVDLQKDLW